MQSGPPAGYGAQGVSPTLGAAEGAAASGIGNYRSDAPQGLGLPPPSTRYPHPQQGFGTPHPPGVQPTPPMTPTPGAAYGAQPGPYAVGGMAQGAWGEAPMSGPTSQSNRNLLFLWLGVSFFVATAVLIVVYVLVLR
jgi:hypothetical protein